MGKKDTITKDYIRRPDIFADVFNQFLYHGRQRIKPEQLVELDTTEIAVPYGTDSASVPEQRYRDVAKMLMAMTDSRAAYCILAVENESKINYAMPVKNGLYDFMQLAKQVTEAAASHRRIGRNGTKPTSDEYLSGFWKTDRLLPVVTLVIYFGADEWDGPLSLKDMYIDCDAEILEYATDYRINLIAPYRLSEEELDKFTTSFREVMKYIKYSLDGSKLKEVVIADKRFKEVERQAVDVINMVTNSTVKYSKRKETVDVCQAIQEIKEEGREEGRLEGEIIGAIRICKKMKVSLEDVKENIMEEYDKSEEETDRLLERYWK